MLIICQIFSQISSCIQIYTTINNQSAQDLYFNACAWTRGRSGAQLYLHLHHGGYIQLIIQSLLQIQNITIRVTEPPAYIWSLCLSKLFQTHSCCTFIRLKLSWILRVFRHSFYTFKQQSQSCLSVDIKRKFYWHNSQFPAMSHVQYESFVAFFLVQLQCRQTDYGNLVSP